MPCWNRIHRALSLLLFAALALTSCANGEPSAPPTPTPTPAPTPPPIQLPPAGDVLAGLIGGTIRIAVVPAILIAMLLLSWRIVRLPSPSTDQRVSKVYALWLGFGVFVLVVILNLYTDFFVPQRPLEAFQRAWLYAVGGFIAGVALLAAVHSFLETRAISILILVLSSASSSAIYFYVLVDGLREAILISTVSLLVGSLAYVVMFPGAVRSLRRPEPWLCSECGRRNDADSDSCYACATPKPRD